MRAVFAGATSFNQPLGKWNVSNVKEMQRMFSDEGESDGDESDLSY